jgi:prepilin peptidase CpaA
MSSSHIVAMSATLVLVLALAVREDLATHRIPNALSFGALLLGIALQSFHGGLSGFGWSVAGAAVGLASLMPLYMTKGMGAGDVKLLMAAGAFLGPLDVLLGALLTLVAGAVLALVVVAWRLLSLPAVPAMSGLGTSGSAKLRSALARATSERFPYAAAIAVGVVTTLWLRGLLGPLTGMFA